MKKLLFLFTFLALLILVTPFNVKAITIAPTVTSSPTKEIITEKQSQQINQLEQKIASHVAQLNLVEKRGIIGVVTNVQSTRIQLTDVQNNNRFVDVDEITKFSSFSSKGSFGLSDLTNGTRVRVLGLYNKDSKRILARFIDVTSSPILLMGEVSDIDSKNFILTISLSTQKQTKIDINTSTKIFVYTKDAPITKLGFSKINIGDRLYTSGFPNKKDSNLLEADRILILPDLPKNPQISISLPTPSINTTPSVAPSPTISTRKPITTP